MCASPSTPRPASRRIHSCPGLDIVCVRLRVDRGHLPPIAGMIAGPRRASSWLAPVADRVQRGDEDDLHHRGHDSRRLSPRRARADRPLAIALHTPQFREALERAMAAAGRLGAVTWIVDLTEDPGVPSQADLAWIESTAVALAKKNGVRAIVNVHGQSMIASMGSKRWSKSATDGGMSTYDCGSLVDALQLASDVASGRGSVGRQAARSSCAARRQRATLAAASRQQRSLPMSDRCHTSSISSGSSWSYSALTYGKAIFRVLSLRLRTELCPERVEPSDVPDDVRKLLETESRRARRARLRAGRVRAHAVRLRRRGPADLVAPAAAPAARRASPGWRSRGRAAPVPLRGDLPRPGRRGPAGRDPGLAVVDEHPGCPKHVVDRRAARSLSPSSGSATSARSRRARTSRRATSRADELVVEQRGRRQVRDRGP